MLTPVLEKPGTAPRLLRSAASFHAESPRNEADLNPKPPWREPSAVPTRRPF